MNLRLTGRFTLRSPLSHIGETISTTAYLVQEPILQPDRTIEETFCYSGNAWRGQLRDLAAAYMLDKLGGGDGPARVNLDAFHLLFSGGRIGGAQVTDIGAARRMRAAIPMLAMWGGGVGNQILAGKMRVSNCYPVCREAIPALPPVLHEEAEKVGYRGLTHEKSFSRRDDAKIDTVAGYIAPPNRDLIGAPTSGEGKPAKDKKASGDGPANQMRMTVELLAAGAALYTEIDILDATDVEVGSLVSALHAFSRSPYIGGQSGKGHGRVTLVYDYLDMDTGKAGAFLAVSDGPALLAPPAQAAKEAYDQHLRQLYDAMLTGRSGEIKGLLGAA